MSARGIWTVERPPVKNGRSNRYACAAIANASVLTARSSPRTRSAPMPTSTAIRQANAAPISIDHGNPIAGRLPRRMRVLCQPMSTESPRDTAAAVSAPSPANAICPSDSCPAHPVSTTTDTAQIANARIDRPRLVPRRLVGRAAGGRSRRASAKPATSCGSGGPTRSPEPLGYRGDRAARTGSSRRPLLRRAAHPGDEHEHDEEQHELHEPGLGRCS